MKILLCIALLGLMLGCQQESLTIEAPYRVKIQAPELPTTLQLRHTYAVPVELVTDSYYTRYGYELVYQQEKGLGRLISAADSAVVMQNVPMNMPLGASSWLYTPHALGECQILLVAKHSKNYTAPDTVRLNFTIVP